MIARSCALAALGVSALVAVVDGGPVAAASALGCDDIVHDPDGALDLERLEPAIRSLALELGADVRVRVEGTLDGGLDRRIEQLIEQCPGWQDTDTDELDDEMVVVMFSPVERENSIFYGAELGPALESRWETATDAMIPDLRTGDYTDAVLEGLGGLTRDPVASSVSGDDTGESDEGVPGEVIFWVVVLVGIALLSLVARQQGWTSGGGDSWDGDDGGTSGWSGRTRRRRSSSRGFGSFGSRSSSRSRSSGGGGSRRAGGGTKKW